MDCDAAGLTIKHSNSSLFVPRHSSDLPSGSKNPHTGVFGPKYYNIAGIWALKRYYLGPWTLRVMLTDQSDNSICSQASSKGLYIGVIWGLCLGFRGYTGVME